MVKLFYRNMSLGSQAYLASSSFKIYQGSQVLLQDKIRPDLRAVAFNGRDLRRSVVTLPFWILD